MHIEYHHMADLTVGFAAVAPQNAPLFPEEEAALGDACAVRRAEFTAGRLLARKTLEHAGLSAGPIGRGSAREPLWPPGAIGSITHTRQFAAAAVAAASRMRAIGIDLERPERMRPRLAEEILTPAERSYYATLPQKDALLFAAAAFSAKEAFCKLQYPLTGKHLSFQDARIEWEGGEQFTLHAQPPFECVAGIIRFDIVPGHLFTLLCILP